MTVLNRRKSESRTTPVTLDESMETIRTNLQLARLVRRAGTPATIIGDRLIQARGAWIQREAVVKRKTGGAANGGVNCGVGCVKPRFSGAPHRDNGGRGRLARREHLRRLPRHRYIR